MSRKAIAYLIMSLTIVSIVVANTMVFSNRFKKVEASSVEIINNEFTESIISDISGDGLDRFLEVASKRAFAYLSDYLAQGAEVDDIAEAINTLMLNGSLNGTMQYKYPTLNKFLGVTTNYYFVLGFRVDKPSIESTFEHLNPWEIIVTSDISYNIIVPRTKFSWVIDVTRTTKLNILGFFDPESGWRIKNDWKHNTSYPSFLDRLLGESGGSGYGVCNTCEGESYTDFVAEAAPACEAEVCDDLADNDCDGIVDCADEDCIGDPACIPD